MHPWRAADRALILLRDRPTAGRTRRANVIIEEGTPSISRGPSRPKWIVAVVAAVALLAAAMGGVAGAFLINGRSAGSGVGGAAGYVPDTAFLYMDARLDLPGDQRALLTELVARFPDGADALIGDELTKSLDDKLSKAGAPISYSKDIAPWFDGRLAVALLEMPSSSQLEKGDMPRGLAFAGVKDRVAATALADRLRSQAEGQGQQLSTTTHRGVEIVTGSATEGGRSHTYAYAITDDQLIFGTDADGIATALDVHAGAAASLEANADVEKLSGGLPSNRVATMVTNYAPLLAQLKGDLGPAGMSGELFDSLAASAPSVMVGAGRIEADRLRFDVAVKVAKDAPAGVNRSRTLDGFIPADAIFVAEGNDLGASLGRAVTALKQGAGSPGAPDKQQVAQIESVLGARIEDFVSWIGDGALVAGYHDDEPYAGLVLAPTDADAAKQRLGQLTSLARLAGGALAVTQEQVAGTEVTTLRLAGGSGVDPMGLGSIGQVALQYAVTPERVVIGFGDKFVGRVLGLNSADSLAGSDRYRSALEGVGGANNAGAAFLDLAALRSRLEAVLEPLAPAEMWSEYVGSVRPWLEPLDYAVGTTQANGDVITQRSAIVLK
jgi:hypothetical protein